MPIQSVGTNPGPNNNIVSQREVSLKEKFKNIVENGKQKLFNFLFPKSPLAGAIPQPLSKIEKTVRHVTPAGGDDLDDVVDCAILSCIAGCFAALVAADIANPHPRHHHHHRYHGGGRDCHRW